MGRLYDLIQDHLDSQEYDISLRQLAGRLGVSPTTVTNWREPTKLIAKEHLVAISRVTRQPYRFVLQALLEDIGYWDEDTDARSKPSVEPTAIGAVEARRKRAEQMRQPVKKAARKDPGKKP